jgi:hypothetical protein
VSDDRTSSKRPPESKEAALVNKHHSSPFDSPPTAIGPSEEAVLTHDVQKRKRKEKEEALKRSEVSKRKVFPEPR